MNKKLLQEAYYGLKQHAENQNVLYTDKEVKMHVFGPKERCDLNVFTRHDLTGCEYGLTQEEGISFFEKGFCISRGDIDIEDIRFAREYIDGQYQSWLRMSKRQDDWRMHLLVDFEDLALQPIEHAPVLNLVLKSPSLLRKLEQLMGSKPSGCFYNQVAYRTPLVDYSPSILEYTIGAEYHIDGQANDFGTRFPDPWTVLVCIALVDIESEDMGNFTVFPGTHTIRNWSHYPEEKRQKTLPSFPEPFKARLKAGDCLLAHVLLPHRGGKNISTAEAAIKKRN